MKAGENLNPDFKEFLTLLVEETVEFALVGGFAVAYHGYPRFTGDMDILIGTGPGNAVKVLKVLGRFGFDHCRSGRLTSTEGNVIQLGYPPVRID